MPSHTAIQQHISRILSHVAFCNVQTRKKFPIEESNSFVASTTRSSSSFFSIKATCLLCFLWSGIIKKHGHFLENYEANLFTCSSFVRTFNVFITVKRTFCINNKMLRNRLDDDNNLF